MEERTNLKQAKVAIIEQKLRKKSGRKKPLDLDGALQAEIIQNRRVEYMVINVNKWKLIAGF